MLDNAVAWARDEGDTIALSRGISKVDSLITQLLHIQPTYADMELEEDAGPDCIQFFDVHVGPVETLVEEVLAHKSVSDNVALKKTRS